MNNMRARPNHMHGAVVPVDRRVLFGIRSNITFSSTHTIRMSYFGKIHPKLAIVVNFLDFFHAFACIRNIHKYSHVRGVQ